MPEKTREKLKREMSEEGVFRSPPYLCFLEVTNKRESRFELCNAILMIRLKNNPKNKSTIKITHYREL